MRETFVIIGAGLTGGSAVVCLREERFQGGLVLIGAEPEVPYERPPLCVEMRGVRDTSPLTRTAVWLGEYEHNPSLRVEFLLACGAER